MLRQNNDMGSYWFSKSTEIIPSNFIQQWMLWSPYFGMVIESCLLNSWNEIKQSILKFTATLWGNWRKVNQNKRHGLLTSHVMFLQDNTHSTWRTPDVLRQFKCDVFNLSIPTARLCSFGLPTVYCSGELSWGIVIRWRWRTSNCCEKLVDFAGVLVLCRKLLSW